MNEDEDPRAKVKRLADEYAKAEAAYAQANTPHAVAWASACRKKLHEAVDALLPEDVAVLRDKAWRYDELCK